MPFWIVNPYHIVGPVIVDVSCFVEMTRVLPDSPHRAVML